MAAPSEVSERSDQLRCCGNPSWTSASGHLRRLDHIAAAHLVAGDAELGRHLIKQPLHHVHALRAAGEVASGRLDDQFATARLGGIEVTARDVHAIRRVKFLGCGSAYYAAQLGAGLMEELARLPTFKGAGSLKKNPVPWGPLTVRMLPVKPRSEARATAVPSTPRT